MRSVCVGNRRTCGAPPAGTCWRDPPLLKYSAQQHIMVTTRRQTKAVALASSDDEVADWGAGDMPAELLEKIAACVLNEELATFCAVSHAYSAGASAVVYARILNLVLLSNDMQPGHNNPAWTTESSHRCSRRPRRKRGRPHASRLRGRPGSPSISFCLRLASVSSRENRCPGCPACSEASRRSFSGRL